MSPAHLFNRLLDLNARYPGRIPEEDFFTELVAYLFESFPEIFFNWLAELGWHRPEGSLSLHIDTQAIYPAMPEHSSGSRPDIRIRIGNGDWQELVFLESKLGAQEGAQQLQRYAEILAQDHTASQKWLLYLTRAKDPKDAAMILRNTGLPVKFIQTRWRNFYKFLAKQDQNLLVEEVIHFMEENGMGEPVEFSEADLSSLGNLQHPFQLLLSVLDKDMQRSYQAVVGSRGSLTPLEYLTRDWARFAIEGEIAEGGLFCLLGFDHLARGENPRLVIMLQVRPEKAYGPNRNLRTQWIELMKEILARYPGWEAWALNNPLEHSLIQKYRPLRSLLPSAEIEDDCKAILAGYLDELAEIKRAYPGHFWKQGG